MTHERLQQLLAWLDEIHWEGEDRAKVDELVSYIDNSTSEPRRRASIGGRINELENLWADASRRAEKAEARVRELEERLHLEQMRLAACGVVAQANTPESSMEARAMHPDYRSASCDDVAKAVDREMALRERVKKIEATLERAWNGDLGLECTDCGRITANGTCTECRRGVSPWKKLEAERDALRQQRQAVLESLEAMTDEVDKARSERDALREQVKRVRNVATGWDSHDEVYGLAMRYVLDALEGE